MLRNNRFPSILLLTALLLSACQPLIQPPAESAAPAQPATYTPRYEPADCFYEISEGEQGTRVALKVLVSMMSAPASR